ncbi:hypothetical protein K458DRAFT_383832 [Lentithecium fluviatile CBS 122367]|uniref:Uncharacterized protein n=1 Tax=Lentithecium fluviatile CBS 122367 TaxID=1168545 RepID=A0A6G1JF31_9PLEO|nr:hypothetical protein K458DRAFT_383832 [Lentithecium fluviatile CBS 122367]
MRATESALSEERAHIPSYTWTPESYRERLQQAERTPHGSCAAAASRRAQLQPVAGRSQPSEAEHLRVAKSSSNVDARPGGHHLITSVDIWMCSSKWIGTSRRRHHVTTHVPSQIPAPWLAGPVAAVPSAASSLGLDGCRPQHEVCSAPLHPEARPTNTRLQTIGPRVPPTARDAVKAPNHASIGEL